MVEKDVLIKWIVVFLFVIALIITFSILNAPPQKDEKAIIEEKLFNETANKSITKIEKEKYPTGEIKVNVSGFTPAEYAYYWLYIPENYTPSIKWPLIIDLHGKGHTGIEYAYYMLKNFWEPVAKKRNYIVVNPQSRARGWATKPYGGKGANSDLAYLLYIIKEVMNDYNIDKNRILLTGSSVGGDFVYPVCILNHNLFSHCVSFMGGLFIDLTKPSFYNFTITEEEMRNVSDKIKFYILASELDKPRMPNTIHYLNYFAEKGFNVTFYIIPGIRHNIPEDKYKEQVLDWFEKDKNISLLKK